MLLSLTELSEHVAERALGLCLPRAGTARAPGGSKPCSAQRGDKGKCVPVASGSEKAAAAQGTLGTGRAGTAKRLRGGFTTHLSRGIIRS